MSGAKPGLPAASPRPDSLGAYLSPLPVGKAPRACWVCQPLPSPLCNPQGVDCITRRLRQQPGRRCAGPETLSALGRPCASSGLGRQGPAPRLEGGPWSGKEPGPLAAASAERLSAIPESQWGNKKNRNGWGTALGSGGRGRLAPRAVWRNRRPQSHSFVLRTPKPTLSKRTKPCCPPPPPTHTASIYFHEVPQMPDLSNLTRRKPFLGLSRGLYSACIVT